MTINTGSLFIILLFCIQCMSFDERDFVIEHNMYRNQHSLPRLQWNDEIASWAQQWANHLKEHNSCHMDHRKPNKYGENIAWFSGRRANPHDVVKMWYEENRYYDYNSNHCSNGHSCGHYTQLMWRNTKEIGCGHSRCENTEVWVCNYDPPGNYNNRRPW